MLSKEALAVIAAVFGEQSNIQLPAALAAQILEIRAWVKAQQDRVCGEGVADRAR
jgi:hypothetical protein